MSTVNLFLRKMGEVKRADASSLVNARMSKDITKDLRKKMLASEAAVPAALESSRQYMDKTLLTGYRAQKDRKTGEKWKPLKKSTLKRHPHRIGKPILKDTADLRKSATRGRMLKPGGKTYGLLYKPSMKLGTKGRKISSAFVHQKGSIKNRTPARPYLRLIDMDEKKINQIYKNAVTDALRREG